MNPLIFVPVFLVPIQIFLRASVGVQLWEWFFMPLGAPPVELVPMIGISLSVHYFMSIAPMSLKVDELHKKLVPEEHTPEQVCSTALVHAVLSPLLVWAFGAIIHSYV